MPTCAAPGTGSPATGDEPRPRRRPRPGGPDRDPSVRRLPEQQRLVVPHRRAGNLPGGLAPAARRADDPRLRRAGPLAAPGARTVVPRPAVGFRAALARPLLRPAPLRLAAHAQGVVLVRPRPPSARLGVRDQVHASRAARGAVGPPLPQCPVRVHGAQPLRRVRRHLPALPHPAPRALPPPARDAGQEPAGGSRDPRRPLPGPAAPQRRSVPGPRRLLHLRADVRGPGGGGAEDRCARPGAGRSEPAPAHRGEGIR